MKTPNLIGIHSFNEENAKSLAIGLSMDLGYTIRTFDDVPVEFIAKSLGCSTQQITDPEQASAYLGYQWSYIREERFVEKEEVSRKPVRYFLTPKSILAKFKKLMRDIHSNFLVNALFASYHEKCNWIIPGSLFPNEIDAIRENGGIIIHLENSKFVQKGDLVYTKYPGVKQIIDDINALP